MTTAPGIGTVRLVAYFAQDLPSTRSRDANKARVPVRRRVNRELMQYGLKLISRHATKVDSNFSLPVFEWSVDHGKRWHPTMSSAAAEAVRILDDRVARGEYGNLEGNADDTAAA
jgi:hypothetical protein